MIMSEKTKDLIHAIAITIAFVICVAMATAGTVYLALMNKFVLGTVIWALITISGSLVFGYGTVICWKEWKLHYKNKE